MNEDPEEKLLLNPDELDEDCWLLKLEVLELLLFHPCALELLSDHPWLLEELLESLELWLLVQLYICGVGDILVLIKEIQINLINLYGELITTFLFDRQSKTE